jgi:hypothetical protein
MPSLDRPSINRDAEARYSLLRHATAIYANARSSAGSAVCVSISARSAETSERRASIVVSAAIFSNSESQTDKRQELILQVLGFRTST